MSPYRMNTPPPADYIPPLTFWQKHRDEIVESISVVGAVTILLIATAMIVCGIAGIFRIVVEEIVGNSVGSFWHYIAGVIILMRAFTFKVQYREAR